MKKPKYHCPWCKTSILLVYDELIECPKCLLEFEKKFLGRIPDTEIMSRQEMTGILDGFEKLKDTKKYKGLLESIIKDLDDLNGPS
jgi:hypothetical protein